MTTENELLHAIELGMKGKTEDVKNLARHLAASYRKSNPWLSRQIIKLLPQGKDYLRQVPVGQWIDWRRKHPGCFLER